MYADCIKIVDPWSVCNNSSSSDFESPAKGTGTGTGGAKLLWSWRSIDHLDETKFPQHPDYPREHWPLINSVALDSEGNVIASSRNTSSVFIISRATGGVIWHLTCLIVNQQHCAHEISEEIGDILILDNGVFRPGLAVPFSRAIIVSRKKEVIWEYKDRATGGLGFFTPLMGSAQKLRNGNVLIAEAATGRIFEVCDDGDVVWEFVVPELSDYRGLMGKEELREMEKIAFSYESNAVFRAYKYAPEEVGWLDYDYTERRE